MEIKNIILICLLIYIASARLPSSTQKCSRNDPGIEKCVLNAIKNLLPLLAKGYLDDGVHIPPFEPLDIEDLKIGNGPEFQTSLTNMKATGGTNVLIDKFKANLTTFEFVISGTLPRIELTGNYKLNVRILGIDIIGEGKFRSSVDQLRELLKIYCTRFEKNGKEYIKINKFSTKFQIKPKSLKLQLDNLFNGDPVLGEVGNKLINENQDLLLDVIKPALETSLSKKFFNIGNSILDGVTIDELYKNE